MSGGLYKASYSSVIHRGVSNAGQHNAARQFFQTARVGQAQNERLQNGDAGIQQIVDKLQAATIEGGKAEKTYELARRIIRGARGPEEQVAKLYEFFSDERECPYVLDPVDKQIAPSVEAAMRANGLDCKGKSVLMAACIRSIGYDTRMVTADMNAGAPGPANDGHIYPEWLNPTSGQWKPIDAVLRTVHPDSQVGDKLPEKRTTLWEEP